MADGSDTYVSQKDNSNNMVILTERTPFLFAILALCDQSPSVIAAHTGINERILFEISRGIIDGTDEQRERLSRYFVMRESDLFRPLTRDELEAVENDF